ncbi:hypothetical protein C2I18_02450 [Paenibacillus sp. PK3_47]|nr:hypothetical protein C2I18_02450 [Paenibacillus sp. PK3_47]
MGKTEDIRPLRGETSHCMRKTEYIRPLRREPGSLYAKNRVHWAAASGNETIILEKPSTFDRYEQKRDHYTRKTEYIGPL